MQQSFDFFKQIRIDYKWFAEEKVDFEKELDILRNTVNFKGIWKPKYTYIYINYLYMYINMGCTYMGYKIWSKVY